MLDVKQMRQDAITQQVERLERVILEYTNYQHLIIEMRYSDNFDADEVKRVLGNFQDMIDMTYRDLLMVSEDQIAQQVRYWRKQI